MGGGGEDQHNNLHVGFNKNIPPQNKLSRDSVSNWCATNELEVVMNEILTITKEGKQSSTMIRLIITLPVVKNDLKA